MAHLGGRPTDYTPDFSFVEEVIKQIPFGHEIYEVKREGNMLHVKSRPSQQMQEWYKEHLKFVAELDKEYGAL